MTAKILRFPTDKVGRFAYSVTVWLCDDSCIMTEIRANDDYDARDKAFKRYPKCVSVFLCKIGQHDKVRYFEGPRA